MSVNGTSSAKAPVRDPQQSSRADRGLVKVQPARLADLQPRYASTIQHDEENPEAHGWYARMSRFNRRVSPPTEISHPSGRVDSNHLYPPLQSTPSENVSVSAVLFPVASAAPILSSPWTKARWVWCHDLDGWCYSLLRISPYFLTDISLQL